MDDSVSTDTTNADQELTVEVCFAAGLQALYSGNIEEAVAWAIQCDTAPGNGNSTDGRCAVLHSLIAAETGDLDASVTYLRHAAQLAPEDILVARRLSEVLIEREAWSEAATTLERAVASKPDDADLLVDLGYFFLMSNNRAKARATLERAASLRPEDEAIQYSLAQMYEALGEAALAIAILLPLAQHTASLQLLNELSLLLLQSSRWDEAEASFVRLQQRDPDHELVAQHGRICCRMKKQDWRGAFHLALEVTRIDRYALTTTLLAYIKDRIFGQGSNYEQREAELVVRVMAELHEHAELHSGEEISNVTAFE